MTFWLGELKKTISAGGVVAYPTEAVWGLGCDPFNEQAVSRLLSTKQRRVEKGLIVLLNESSAELLFTHQPAEIKKRCFATWPGHHTWLIPNNGFFPPSITGNHDTVAVRISAHAPTRQVVDAAGGYLVSSSANTAGKKAAQHSWQIGKDLRSQIDFISPGSCGRAARPSVIANAITGEVLRP